MLWERKIRGFHDCRRKFLDFCFQIWLEGPIGFSISLPFVNLIKSFGFGFVINVMWMRNLWRIGLQPKILGLVDPSHFIHIVSILAFLIWLLWCKHFQCNCFRSTSPLRGKQKIWIQRVHSAYLHTYLLNVLTWLKCIYTSPGSSLRIVIVMLFVLIFICIISWSTTSSKSFSGFLQS